MRKSQTKASSDDQQGHGSLRGSIVLELARDTFGNVKGVFPVHSSTIFVAADRGVQTGYVQVVNGKPVQAFREDELVVITPEHISGNLPR